MDALVRALADDVLDSFDPDHDGDGRREREDGILLQGGNIWEFLPDNVKKEREEGAKKARWAININVIANILLLVAKVCFPVTSRALLRQSKPMMPMTGHSSLLLRVIVSDRVAGRLRSRSSLYSHRLDYKPPRRMAIESS